MTPFLPIGVVDSGGLAAMTEAQAKVYMVLCRHAQARTLRAWPSVARVARLAGLTERSVQKALRGLEQAGQIATRRGGGRSHTSVYDLIEKGEPGFTVSGRKGERGRPKRANGGSPEGSMKEERGGAASPPVDATGTNPPPEDPAHGNGAGGRVIALWCQGYRERTGQAYPPSGKGKLAGLLKRMLADHPQDDLSFAVQQWFGKPRKEYGVELFKLKLEGADAELTGRSAQSPDDDLHAASARRFLADTANPSMRTAT